MFPLLDDPMGLVPAVIIEMKRPLTVCAWKQATLARSDEVLQGAVCFEIAGTDYSSRSGSSFECICLPVLVRWPAEKPSKQVL